MARRAKAPDPIPIRKDNGKLVLMGDVRPTALQVREGDRVFNAVVALWVCANDGQVVGFMAGKPGSLAQILMEAFRKAESTPRQQRTFSQPCEVVLFNEELAKQMKPMFAPLNVKVLVSPPLKPFDDIFTDILDGVQAAQPELDLPPEVRRPLLSAAERLWRAKPWEYTWDSPPLAVVPEGAAGRPLYAAVLGHGEETFGIALYTSLDDYEDVLLLGESLDDEEESPEALSAGALKVLRNRELLVSFEPADEMPPGYREQLVRLGWPSRLRTVPTFLGLGGIEKPGPFTAEEASEAAVAIDALVAFCQRHRKRLADEDFPIHDTIEVGQGANGVRVAVSIPGEDQAPPPATVYRFKVSLTYDKDVWRRIDLRSDQTLEDLHYAIQHAFNWDDDHGYSFFMSGKAWDGSTAYVRPAARESGDGSAEVRLRRLGLHPRQRFLYIFDFGDEWRHDIRVEKAGLAADEGEYPRVVESHGEAPAQYPIVEDDEEDGWDSED